MTWAVPVWITSVLSGLILSIGLSRGLRGAYVGGASAISAADFVASVSSQIAAILTILLLVQLSLRALGHFTNLIVGGFTALITLAVSFALILAHRLELPEELIAWSMLASGIVVESAALFSKLKGQTRLSLGLSGASLLLGFVLTLTKDQRSTALVAQLAWAANLTCLAALACNIFWLDFRKAKHVSSLIALALSTLVYFAAQRNDPETPVLVVLVRSLRSLFSSAGRPEIITWALCVTTALLVVEMFRNRSIKDALLYFSVVVSLAAPSVMSAACLSLVALSLVEMENAAPARLWAANSRS